MKHQFSLAIVVLRSIVSCKKHEKMLPALTQRFQQAIEKFWPLIEPNN